MTRDSLRRFGSGRSPFDDIMHVEDDGTEWWSAREMMGPLGYLRWEGLENVIDKAKMTCRMSGHQPWNHFRDMSKIVHFGSGAQRAIADVQMTRFGCYLLAMSGDPSKPQVAAARRYFALMTRAAEIGRSAEAAAPTVPVVARPWSERFRDTFQSHVRFMYENHPGCFTVVTTLVGQMLSLEDELIRHMLQPRPSDRPDISIGLCWGNERRARGLPPAERYAPLWLPDQEISVDLRVYDDSERGAFEMWFGLTYLPDKLPGYLANKPGFSVHGELPPASAADNTCRGLTGRSARLKPHLRRQLDAAGGFFPAGMKPPELGGAQGMLPFLS